MQLPQQPPDEMTWLLRMLAAGAGGIASLFALFIAPPKDTMERVVRFFAGCFFAGCLAGFIIPILHLAFGIDNVLFVGIVCGLCCWWFAIWVVTWSKDGGLAAFLSRRFQDYTDNKPKPKNGD